MARVTVEDCLKHVDNRFDLVIKAAERAHKLELGAVDPTVDPENDKPTVIALREIAAGHDITKTRRDLDKEAEAESETAETSPQSEADAPTSEEGGQVVAEDSVQGTDD